MPNDFKQFVKELLSAQPIELTETQLIGASEILEQFYLSHTPDDNPTVSAAKLEADMMFTYPEMANIATHKGPKWIYRFEYENEISKIFKSLFNMTGKDALHASQMAAYLNVRSNYPILSPTETPEDLEVSKRMIKYLVNFAYYDNPTPGDSPFKWKQYRGKELLRITQQGDYFADDATLRAVLDVYDIWDTIYGTKAV